MKRRGFTLVELMMVVSILAVLMTIVVSSISSSMKAARERRTAALCQAVQAGLATYYAINEKWPSPLDSKVASGNFNDDEYELSSSEVRQLVKVLVDEAKQGRPMMDISGLFVSRDPGERGSNGYGMDFFTAVRGDKRSKKKMKTAEMYFGYPEKDSGKFRRFRMVYSVPTDSVRVTVQ